MCPWPALHLISSFPGPHMRPHDGHLWKVNLAEMFLTCTLETKPLNSRASIFTHVQLSSFPVTFPIFILLLLSYLLWELAGVKIVWDYEQSQLNQKALLSRNSQCKFQLNESILVQLTKDGPVTLKLSSLTSIIINVFITVLSGKCNCYLIRAKNLGLNKGPY